MRKRALGFRVRQRAARRRIFISRQSVERYAEELRQIDAIATIGDEARHDAPQRDTTRHDAPQRDRANEVPRSAPEAKRDVSAESADLKHREDEILNLRIDNSAKEQVITMLRDERREMQVQLQDVTYRLGASESRLALLEASKPEDDTERQAATNSDSNFADAPADTAMPEKGSSPVLTTAATVIEPTPKQSFLGRLLR